MKKTKKKSLIVTAHDFGLCHSVNQGIVWILKHPSNIITELSLLPNAPGSQEAAEIAKRLKISVSLNTNFTTFTPLSSNVPSLVDKNGEFKKVDVSKWNFSAIETFREEDIVKELDAQWEWFVKNVGRKPSAILSRKNEFSDPKMLIPFVEKAKKEGVPLRTPVWMWKRNYAAQSFVRQEGVKTTTNVFIGIKDWKGRFGYDMEEEGDKLVKDILKSEEVSELIVFAGFVDEELFKISKVNWQRGQFFRVLQNKEFITSLKQHFQLISYQDL